MNAPLILWFRQDLRLHDLPALHAAIASGRPLIAVYILDDTLGSEWSAGGASRWWLHHSLKSLASEINALGGTLVLRRGDSASILQELLEQTGADTVYCTRQYEPWSVVLEQQLHTTLGQHNRSLRRYPGHLLFEPEAVRNQSGQPFKVFTPFWRNCCNLGPPGEELPTPKVGSIEWYTPPQTSDALESWALQPAQPDWAAGWDSLWQPGTQGALSRLQAFLSGPVADYAAQRDVPAVNGTSRLSPHLHFGELSPRTVWHAAQRTAAQAPELAAGVKKFLAELGWREFCHHLLFAFPHITQAPFKAQFEGFPWAGTESDLRAWQRGNTGYPIVDAGMRELWATGYMHNRVRMIVASFLTKHLRTHWLAGARWFHDTLLDADAANNLCSWQWAAGSGADAAPYFRIFNPFAQGEKFDAQGHYVRRWVPELAALPDRYLHRPWEAPGGVLQAAEVRLGETYPRPMVEHKEARAAALAAYEQIKLPAS